MKAKTNQIIRQKVALAHPKMCRGGSEAAVMWGITALKDQYDITLLTTGDIDLEAWNDFYGTSLSSSDFNISIAPTPAILRKTNKAAALRGAFYQRHCRKLSYRFDVMISAYNLCDFGIAAIHCLADFSWDEEIRERLDPPLGSKNWFYRDNPLRKIYLKMAKIVSPPSRRDLFGGEDLILANSKWTANIIKKKYGSAIDILYPAVLLNFPSSFPEKREAGFVCIGRISPEKRIEDIIEILQKVRERGHDIHLHIIGNTTGTSYGNFIEKTCRNSLWIKLEGSLFGVEKANMLLQHRFGLHARPSEPFGISVAEMAKAGCVTFVPSKGGQAEIVEHPSLIYENAQDAVEKIDIVLRRPKLENELRTHLRKQAEKFSAEVFMATLKNAVERFLRNKNCQKK